MLIASVTFSPAGTNHKSDFKRRPIYILDVSEIMRICVIESNNIAQNTSITFPRQVISHLLLTLVICILNITVGMH